MARYCFYCGRELAQGERCSCRSRGSAYRPEFHNADGNASAAGSQPGSGTKAASAASASSSAASSASSGGPKDGGSSSPNPKKRKRSFRERFAAWSADRVNAANARKRERKAQREARKAASAQRQSERTPMSAVRFLHRLFTKPTEIIASAKHAGRFRLWVAYLLEAFVFSFGVLIFVRFSSLTRIAMLRELNLNDTSLWKSAFQAMIRGFFAALMLSLFRVLISRMVLRFVGRQRIAIEDLFRAFLPGTYYEIVIMLFALLFVGGSGLQALVMMLCAVALRVVIDTLSLKGIVQLSQDRLLVQSAVIHFLLFIALSFFLNFAVPSLVRSSVAPSGRKPIVPNLRISEVYKL